MTTPDKLNCKHNTQALELIEQKRLLTDCQKKKKRKETSVTGVYTKKILLFNCNQNHSVALKIHSSI